MTLMFELIKHMASSLPAASNALYSVYIIYLFIYLFIFSSKWWDQICQVSSSSAKQKSLVSIEKKKLNQEFLTIWTPSYFKHYILQ